MTSQAPGAGTHEMASQQSDHASGPRFIRFLSVLKTVPTAITRTWPYVLWGILAGATLAWAASSLASYVGVAGHSAMLSFLTSLFEHLSTGFFVSSICVFLYEWGAHFREILEKSERLSLALENHIDEILDTSTEAALSHAIARLVGRSGYRLHADILRISKALGKLHSNRGWSGKPYVAFLQDWFEKVADNADNLADLGERIATRERIANPCILKLPLPGGLADVILSQAVVALDKAGAYLAVSDIDSWLVLPLFEAAQHAAVKGGVRIRRVFLITHPPSIETCQVLSRHYAFASAWTREAASAETAGSYHVRFLNADQLEIVQPQLARAKHFGIFVPSQLAEFAVEFKVTEPDLSTFSMSALAGDGDDIQRFENLWSRLDDLDVTRRVEYLLKLQLELLPDGGSYHVISDFRSWRNDQLTEFHVETIAAIEVRHITARRVFVLRPTEDIHECREILRRHYNDMMRLKRDGHEPYAVTVCNLAEAEVELGAKWHFGVFRDMARPGHGVNITLSESTEEDMSDFVLDRLHDQERVRQMERFFNSVGDVKVRARDVLKMDL